MFIGLPIIHSAFARSADNTIHLFDRRNLSSSGVGSPVHKFVGHSAAVLCVQVPKIISNNLHSSKSPLFSTVLSVLLDVCVIDNKSLVFAVVP